MVETVVTVEHTVTQTSAPTGGGIGALQFNVAYFRTPPGILKLVQFILGIICTICASPSYFTSTSFFMFVIVVSLIATVLWSFAYLLGIREALNVAVNWIFTELINTAICTLLYLIGFVVQLAVWSSYPYYYMDIHGRNIAAGVFGLFNCLAYGAGTFFLYLAHKSGSNY